MKFPFNYRPIVDEINQEDNFTVKRFVCDMVERHNIKGLAGHSGHNSCEVCEAPGNGPNGAIDFDYPRSTRYRNRCGVRWRVIAR